MNCPNPNCNTKNLPNEARFCPNCGAEILPPIMVVKSCKVTPKSVKLGDECKIQWQGDFVQHVVIEGVKYTQKSISLQPKHSQTLAVTFVGLDGSTLTKEVNISVVVPQPDIQITAPEYANPNDKVLINWDAKFVDKVTIGDKSFNANDKVSLVHENGKTICEILFHGIDGSVVPKIVKVRKALPANVESCILEPEYISEREPVSISWKGEHVVRWGIIGDRKLPSSTNSRTFTPVTDKDIRVTFQGEDDNTIEKVLIPKIFKVNFCKVDQKKIVLGESVTISWDAQHTKYVTIFGKKQPEKGSYTWTPTEICTISCPVKFIGMNDAIITETIMVRVRPKPQIVRFEIAENNLVWETVGMQGGTINGKILGDICHGQFTHNTNDFINSGKILLDCWDWRNQHYKQEIPPQILSFSANTQQLYKGQKALLKWGTFGMQKIILNGITQKASGSISIPITTNQIKLECWDKENKYYYKVLDFEVSNPQIVTFKASSDQVVMGDAVTITWGTQGMEKIKLQGNEYYSRGTVTLPITLPTMLLECWGYDEVYYSQTINFDILPSPEIFIYAEEKTIFQGNSTTIRWNCKNVQNVQLNGDSIGLSGQKTIRLDSIGKHNLKLTAENLLGQQTKGKIVSIDVKKDERLLTFFGSIVVGIFTCGLSFMGAFVYNIFKGFTNEDSFSAGALIGSAIGGAIMLILLSLS